MSFIFVMAKLYFQQASLQLSESHDPSEIIYADLVMLMVMLKTLNCWKLFNIY